MAKKQKETKEEVEKTTKTKKTSGSAKFTLKELFDKSELTEDQIEELLLLNGLGNSIEEINLKLTKKQFQEVIEDYLNKRL